MQIIFHTGAHFTEDDRLMNCLLRNKEGFAQRGVSVPEPGRYRMLLKDTLNAMRDAPLGPDARDVVMDAFLDDETPERMILSNAHFFGAPRAALRDGLLYPNAPEKIRQLRRLFPDDDLEIFMAMRNPATLLPAIYNESPRDELDDFLEGVDPRGILWSRSLSAMRVLNPAIPITVWCNEDMPLIWGSILRAMAGLPELTRITGSFDLLAAIITPEGMKRFRGYLKDHPDMNEPQRRRIMAVFLEKYAIEHEMVEELDMPGWSDELVAEMTEVYDADFEAVRQIPGVSVIAP